ncbi:hypothetical protein PG985_011213 [Apiospora marii]|uniref:Infection structure specific protein n=1 Tax=Apiospora marii TaxID=335849 RepID=A0ABR1ST18_9PEZI
MHNQVLLSAALAGLASTVGATYNHAAANQLRDLTAPAHVVARQASESGSSDCTSSAVMLIAGLPTPTGELLSYYATASDVPQFTETAIPTNLASACSALGTQMSVPSSLSAPLSSYESTLLGWYSSHTQDIAGLMSACTADPVFSSAESLLAQVTKEPACKSLLGDASIALPTPTPTGSASGSGEGAAQSSEPAKAAAPKPTAMVAGAVAAAGFIGAVAML